MDDRMKEQAYISLMVNCDQCLASFDTFTEHPPADPMEEWAEMVSEMAQKSGWTADDTGRVLCPECSAKRGRGPA